MEEKHYKRQTVKKLVKASLKGIFCLKVASVEKRGPPKNFFLDKVVSRPPPLLDICDKKGFPKLQRETLAKLIYAKKSNSFLANLCQEKLKNPFVTNVPRLKIVKIGSQTPSPL